MITYTEYPPDAILTPYIAAYWTLETGPLYQPVVRRIFADGCTEIFINLGNSRPTINQAKALSPGGIYFGGTMTVSSQVGSVPDSRFMGIRFKPSGFAAFYNWPMDELVDEIVEFTDRDLYLLAELDQGMADRLDRYFARKLKSNCRETIIAMTHTIEQSNGIIAVDQVAQLHNVSHRTLERAFLRNIGISPKAYIKIIRFQHAAKKLQHITDDYNLLRVAVDMGYYDHAHFTREVKKYSGLNPSELSRKI